MNADRPTGLRDTVITLAGILILLGIARYASAIVVPLLLSLFISIVAASPINWLKDRGLPSWLSIGIVLLSTIIVLILLSTMLGRTMVQFNEALPVYQARLSELTESIFVLLSERGIDLETAGVLDAIDPGAIMTFANSLMVGLADALGNAVMIMFTTMFLLLDSLDFPRKVQSAQGDNSKKILDQIEERIDNVVCLEEQIKNWPTVIFDRSEAARKAVKHLIDLGHERIAFLAINDERLTGYRQTLLDHNLLYDDGLVFITDPTDVLHSAYNSTIEILQMDPRPTAIFAANDESAISAIAAMSDLEVKVPQDVAIVSIDNIGIAEMIRPSLTTVDVPKKRMATYAMQVMMLQNQFKDQQSASIVVPTELIIRDSCGAKNI